MIIFPGIVALRMTALQIPQHVVLNETVRMQCNFNLDKELLYSVKWYKDGHEFYRYVPRDVPMVQTFRVPGVDVNVSIRLTMILSWKIDDLLFNCRRIIPRKDRWFWTMWILLAQGGIDARCLPRLQPFRPCLTMQTWW